MGREADLWIEENRERMEEKVHNVDDFIGKVDWFR